MNATLGLVSSRTLCLCRRGMDARALWACWNAAGAATCAAMAKTLMPFAVPIICQLGYYAPPPRTIMQHLILFSQKLASRGKCQGRRSLNIS